MARDRTPCVAGDSEAGTCAASLLFGAACCPDGTCALCRATIERMRQSGFSTDAIARSAARMRKGLLDRCPVCGFPPPPAITVLPPLARLDRSDRVLSGSPACRVCGQALRAPQRHYCSNECWLQRRRETEGWGANGDRRSPAPVAAVRFGHA